MRRAKPIAMLVKAQEGASLKGTGLDDSCHSSFFNFDEMSKHNYSFLLLQILKTENAAKKHTEFYNTDQLSDKSTN